MPPSLVLPYRAAPSWSALTAQFDAAAPRRGGCYTWAAGGRGHDQDGDARPSDALNLALLLDTPIQVAPAVLEAARSAAAAPARQGQEVQDEVYGEGTEGAVEIAAQWRK